MLRARARREDTQPDRLSALLHHAIPTLMAPAMNFGQPLWTRRVDGAVIQQGRLAYAAGDRIAQPPRSMRKRWGLGVERDWALSSRSSASFLAPWCIVVSIRGWIRSVVGAVTLISSASFCCSKKWQDDICRAATGTLS